MRFAGSTTLRPATWSWARTGTAIVAALAIHFGLSAAIPVVAEGFGYEPSFRDAGDIFEQAGKAVDYADERLAALATAAPLPDPPQLRGDERTARVAYAAGIIDLALLGLVVFVAVGKGPGTFAREMGLDRSPLEGISTPIIAAAVTLLAVAASAAVVRAAGLDGVLTSEPAPDTVLRDGPALALFAVAAVLGAPIAEELLFRGLVLRRLLSLGTPIAVAGSSLLFAAWHLSPAVIPLLVLGAVLAWLYLRSATLWQPIIFHAIFNFVSFVQFAGSR